MNPRKNPATAVATWVCLLSLGCPPLSRADDANSLINPDAVFRGEIRDVVAPGDIRRLIDTGDVRITFVDAPDLQFRQGKTHYFLEVEWKYGFRYTGSREAGRTTFKLTATDVKLEVSRRHIIRVIPTYLTPRVWKSQLLRHEFDHVAVSSDPRPIQLIHHLNRQLPTVEFTLRDGKPGDELCQKLINQQLDARKAAVVDVISANYVVLDKLTNHGQIPLPDRESFFARLYTRPNLVETRFPYVDEVSDLLATEAYQTARPHFLAVDPTTPLP